MSVSFGDRVLAVVEMSNPAVGAVQNAFQLTNVGVGTVANADVLDDVVEILEALYDLLETIISIAIVVNRIRVTNQSDGTDVGVASFVDSTPFTNANNRLAPQLSYVLTLYTPFLSSRGRKFFGPVIGDNVSTVGLVNAAGLTAIGNVGTAMIADAVATNTTWEHGIQTLNHGWQQFTAFQVSPYVGVQRRRKFAVGI